MYKEPELQQILSNHHNQHQIGNKQKQYSYNNELVQNSGVKDFLTYLRHFSYTFGDFRPFFEIISAKEKPLKHNSFKGLNFGAICGTRTHDLLITKLNQDIT